ncbi:MAG: AAA family ATPase [Gammaproteobacteria bacterium]
MYYEYFGLKQPPFKITPDTSLFFPGGDRGAILDALIYAIVSGEGIVKLVGEVGSGKTTLCRMLEKELPDNIEIVYLANPSLSPDNILHAIAFELGLHVNANESRLQVMNELQNYLLERHAENKQVVVFVEEAQSMPIATLEEIRLLSNLETANSKLLQIVIFGQPELDSMIARQEIRQLKERITYSFYLSPLKPHEIREYINSRLRACGYRSVELFNDRAIKAIANYSKGLLRRINILADKSLLATYAANLNTVTAKQVELAANETEFHSGAKVRQYNWSLIFGSLLILIAVMVAIPYLLATGKTSENRAEIETVVQDSSSQPDVSTPVQPNTAKPLASHSVKAIPEEEQVPAEWQQLDQEVYVYREETDSIIDTVWQQLDHEVNVYQDQPGAITNSVTDAEKVVPGQIEAEPMANVNSDSEHGQDENRLLQQLTKLPPEVLMNDETVATDMTCKLCSTIIYRPLKQDSKL